MTPLDPYRVSRLLRNSRLRPGVPAVPSGVSTVATTTAIHQETRFLPVARTRHCSVGTACINGNTKSACLSC